MYINADFNTKIVVTSVFVVTSVLEPQIFGENVKIFIFLFSAEILVKSPLYMMSIEASVSL